MRIEGDPEFQVRLAGSLRSIGFAVWMLEKGL
jgi:hypothetical protein